MKILVTGHKGFIGSNLMESLLLDGHDVIGWDWQDYQCQPRIVFDDLDAVCHIGAISSTTERDVDKIMNQNYDFSCWLLENCNEYGIHFQYSSSASVYGLNQDFSEISPVDPKTPYAWSKYMFERFAHKSDNNYNTTVQGFRYFNVYGPNEDHKGNQASPYHQFKKQAETTGKIKVFENSENYLRDFIHVDAVVDIHKAFLNITESGVWNVGTGNPKSFLDVAKSFNAPIETIPMPEILKDSYQKYTCADTTKLKKTLNTNGYSPCDIFGDNNENGIVVRQTNSTSN